MKTQSEQAKAASAIRAELKAKWPEIRFAIKSSGFAGGNAVDIEWTDGPSTKLVSAITSKYQYGNFDGMEDMYHYNNKQQGLPQVKYVQTQRRVSESTYQAFFEDMRKNWVCLEGVAKLDDPINDDRAGYQTARQFIWRERLSAIDYIPAMK